MPYDVSIGYGIDEPPKLVRIPRSQSDGSCTTIKEAKEWLLREFSYWYEEQVRDIEDLRASDVYQE